MKHFHTHPHLHSTNYSMNTFRFSSFVEDSFYVIKTFCTFRFFFLVRKPVSIQRNEGEGRDEGAEAKE